MFQRKDQSEPAGQRSRPPSFAPPLEARPVVGATGDLENKTPISRGFLYSERKKRCRDAGPQGKLVTNPDAKSTAEAIRPNAQTGS